MPRWLSIALIVLGLVLTFVGIVICGLVGYCAVELSQAGSSGSFATFAPIMFALVVPFIGAGLVMLVSGIAMRRGRPP